MFRDGEYPPVVFRVRVGREQFTLKGRLQREGGVVYATVEEMPDDCPFLPDRIRLEEDDLELKHDAAGGEDYYQYHGWVVAF
jgi:hypothetical protein